ncbi:MAG: helix-turn-helix transcriptional regulator [Armatimonadetes bacterium]|nr:helix-turn-helix transcriptional regulator [Armatimonadota bacterium]
MHPETTILNHARREIGDGIAIGYGHFTRQATAYTEMHSHEEAFLALVTEGQCQERLEKGEAQLLPNNCFALYGPEASHARIPGPQGYSVFGIALPHHLTQKINLKPKQVRKLLQPGVRPARFQQEFKCPDAYSELALTAMVYELLADAGRAEPRDSKAPSWLLRVRERIEDDRTLPRLSDLAYEAGMEESYLSRCFRLHFGQSIGEYSRQVRIDQVRKDLMQTELPLGALAAQYGFTDETHLCKIFKKAFGVAPGQYRKSTHSN